VCSWPCLPRSGIAGCNPPGFAVELDSTAVGEDPLRSGVPEGNPDAHDGVRVVQCEFGADHIALCGAEPSPFGGRGNLPVAADWRPGEHHAVDRPQDTTLAERSNPSLDPICGSQQFAGFEDQDCVPERVDGGQPVGDGELVEDFDAAAPGVTGDRASGTCPRPGFGGFAVAVFDECPRLEPIGPKSSDSPGSVISSSPPVSSAARREARWTSSAPGPAPRWTWVDPP